MSPRKYLTYANVVSTLCLFMLLGGVAYAGTQLAKNSVGTKQLKSKAVTKAKLAPNSVTGQSVVDGSLTGADINASTLGKVPSAASAEQANSAKTAGSANTANSANSAKTANTANSAKTATTANTADTAKSAETAKSATNAGHADTADTATSADHADTAGTATNADHATSATDADHATTADTAKSVEKATEAERATTADTATNAGHADSATNADHATEAEKAATAAESEKLGGHAASEFGSAVLASGPLRSAAPSFYRITGENEKESGSAQAASTLMPNRKLVATDFAVHLGGLGGINNQITISLVVNGTEHPVCSAFPLLPGTCTPEVSIAIPAQAEVAWQISSTPPMLLEPQFAMELIPG
jgi:hypothetical protein